jgi:ubiquinone/menaquinone biosynthesis C-methylase UbiE
MADATTDISSMWDLRAREHGLHSVFSKRWTDAECSQVDVTQCAAMIDLAGHIAERDVLDLGCGIGRLTSRIVRRAGYVAGVDVSAPMIARAKREVRGAEFFVMTPGALPFAACRFDCIMASFVFQHILDDEVFLQTLDECRRVLRAGGCIAMMEGIGAKSYRPTNSHSTVVRTVAQFAAGLQKGFRLERLEQYTWVNDAYTGLLWRAST